MSAETVQRTLDEITPAWAADYEDPVIVSGYQGKKYHEPDFTSATPAPVCACGNREIDWQVHERAFEDGWTDHCASCPNDGGQQ